MPEHPNYDHELTPEGPWLPPHIRDSVRRYIEQGREPGSFLTAVLFNDLREAFSNADIINREYLFNIVCWFYNEAPGPCWGSEANVKAWTTKRTS